MDTKKIFSERLLKLRENNHYKRQKVADDIGISRASLEYYEKGQRLPDIEILAKIADYYNVSADYLLGRSEAKVLNADIQSIAERTGLSDTALERLSGSFSQKYNDMLNDETMQEVIKEVDGFEENIRSVIRDYSEAANRIIEAYLLDMAVLLAALKKDSSIISSNPAFILESNRGIQAIADKLRVHKNVIFRHLKSLPLPSADDLNALDEKCDMRRYNLIRVCESINDNFDLRKKYLDFDREELLKYLNLTEEKLKELQNEIEKEYHNGKHNKETK